MNTEILLKIVAYRQEPRPIAWIARETGLDTKDVRAVLRVAGDSVPKSETALDKYDRMEYLVEQGCSINEVMRTLGGNQATIKRWFPGAGITRGSAEHKQAAKNGRRMKRLEEQNTLLRRKAVPGPPPPGDPRHGTRHCYNIYKCRCADCRAANAQASAERRRKLKERKK